MGATEPRTTRACRTCPPETARFTQASTSGQSKDSFSFSFLYTDREPSAGAGMRTVWMISPGASTFSLSASSVGRTKKSSIAIVRFPFGEIVSSFAP